MIPADGEELPAGSEWDIVRKVRSAAAAAPRQGGTVTLIEDDERGGFRVIGSRAWGGSPMFVVLEYFGLPFTYANYERIISAVRSEGGRELFIRPLEDQPDDEPARAAIVQTMGGWGLEEAEEFLKQHRQ